MRYGYPVSPFASLKKATARPQAGDFVPFFRNPFATQRKGPSQGIIHCQKLLEIYAGTLTYECLDGSGNRARIVWPFKKVCCHVQML